MTTPAPDDASRPSASTDERVVWTDTDGDTWSEPVSQPAAGDDASPPDPRDVEIARLRRDLRTAIDAVQLLGSAAGAGASARADVTPQALRSLFVLMARRADEVLAELAP